MRRSSRQFRPIEPGENGEPIQTDDGGSGLLDACRTRFASRDYEIECDTRHTVWVKRSDGRRSVGLPPWSLRQRTVSQVLEQVAEKLALPVGER